MPVCMQLLETGAATAAPLARKYAYGGSQQLYERFIVGMHGCWLRRLNLIIGPRIPSYER